MRSKLSILFLLTLIVSSCIHKGIDSCSMEYTIQIKPEDNSGFDISNAPDLSDGYLYVFDQKGMLLNKHYVSLDALVYQEPLVLDLCPKQAYKLVVWTAKDIEKMTQINPDKTIKNNFVFFLKDKEEYKVIPSSIYHGMATVAVQKGKNNKYQDEIVVRRKLASMHISMSGIHADDNPDDYRIEIEGGAYGAFTFEGKANKASTTLNKYQSKVEWMNANRLMVMPTAIYVAPTEIDRPFIVSVYYKNNLIKKFTKDYINTPLAPQAGERLNILIDMNQNGSGGIGDPSAHLQVIVRVSDWNKVELWEEW